MSVLAHLSGPRRNKLVFLSALALVGVGVSVVASEIGDEDASAATIGTVSLTPASGSFSAPTTFTASAACPAASNSFRVTMVGGGVDGDAAAAGNQADNLVGTSTLDASKLVSGVAIAAGTFQDFANSNNSGSAYTLAGAATVTILCLNTSDPFAEVNHGDFTSTVTFSGSGTSTTYAGAASPSLTPTPTPGTPTPSPSPAGATPTPTPAADDPTPTPKACADCGGDDDDADTDSENGPLPSTGGQDPTRIYLLAGMLGVAGAAILLFVSATRYREDWE